MTTNELEELKRQADAGDVHAQYNLSVHYLNTGNIPEAYKYCFNAAREGHDLATYNLGLMYTDGKTPVFDFIASSQLLSTVQSMDAKTLEEVKSTLAQNIDTYRPFARLNPQLPSDQVPRIKGVRECLEQYLQLLQERDLRGALCGRLGSIGHYPMVELARASQFRSVAGMNRMENPSEGICLVVTFVQVSDQPTRGNLEEAFWHTRFKALDVYPEFLSTMTYNVRGADGKLADVWEYTADCGDDIDKAERVACSVLYHLYGYKRGAMYPPISFEPYFDGFAFAPDEQSPDDVTSLLYHNIEQSCWFDALMLILICAGCGYFYAAGSLNLAGALIIAAMGVFMYLMYGIALLSKFRTMKYPKRNYIRFLRNPNSPW